MLLSRPPSTLPNVAGSAPRARAAAWVRIAPSRWSNSASLRTSMRRTASSLALASFSAAPASSEEGRGPAEYCNARGAVRKGVAKVTLVMVILWPRLNQQLAYQGYAPAMERASRANRAKRGSRAGQFERKKRSKIHQSDKPWPPLNHRRASECVAARLHHVAHSFWVFHWLEMDLPPAGEKVFVKCAGNPGKAKQGSAVKNRHLIKINRIMLAHGLNYLPWTRRILVRNDDVFSRRRPEL
jgi:hypothetical protein